MLVMSACALNKKAYRNTQEMAVISYNASDKVKNNSSLQARVVSDVRLGDTTLTDPAGKVKNSLFDNLNKSFLQKIVDEEKIIETKSFKAYAEEHDYEQSKLNEIVNLGVGYEAIKGYPVILPTDKKTIKKAFNYLPENIDAVMVVSSRLWFDEDATFNVGGYSSAGLSNQRVQSALTVCIVNKNGKKVFYKSFLGKSAGKLGDEDNKFTLNELVDQALKDSFLKFNRYMEKKLD